MPRLPALIFSCLVALPIQAQQTELIDLYTYFHTNPELSFQEVHTSARVAIDLLN